MKEKGVSCKERRRGRERGNKEEEGRERGKDRERGERGGREGGARRRERGILFPTHGLAEASNDLAGCGLEDCPHLLRRLGWTARWWLPARSCDCRRPTCGAAGYSVHALSGSTALCAL